MLTISEKQVYYPMPLCIKEINEMKREPQPYVTTTGGRIIYLSNKELLREILLSKEQGKMSDTLAKMLQLLCYRYSKHPGFVGYSYNEDLQSYALMMLVRTWNSFNPDKSNNPFAFYTQCIKHSFVQYLNQEKKQRTIRDNLLIDQGMSPSFGYTNGNDEENGADHTVPGIEDEQDFDANQILASYIKRITPTENAPIMRDAMGEEIVHTTSDGE